MCVYFDDLLAVIFDIGDLNLVALVVLGLYADRQGFQLHIQVFRDQYGSLRAFAFYIQAKSQYPMIRILQIPKNLLEPLLLPAWFRRSEQFTDCDANRASARRLRTARHELAVLIEASRQEPMHGSRICTPFRLLIVELVKFAQNIDRNPDMVVRESINGMRIMQEDVCINDIILDAGLAPIGRLRRTPAVALLRRIVKKPGLIFGNI